MSAFSEDMTRRRKDAGISQAKLAADAHVDPGHLSRIATGKADPTPELAEQLDRTLQAGGDLAALARIDRMSVLDTPTTEVDDRVRASQAEWVTTRRSIGTHRQALTAAAAALHPRQAKVPGAHLLTRPQWMPDKPLPLDQITVRHQVAPPSLVDGSGPLMSHLLPLRTVTTRFSRYTAAIRDLASPRLFVSRPSWQILDVDGTDMAFGDCMYFDGVDVQEAAAHELALASVDAAGQVLARAPRLRDLPLRHAIADPTDLPRRPTLAAVSTLTIRADGRGGGSFLLHHRDVGAVAQDGGQIQVIPSGIFQPSSLYPGVRDDDFDLWRNVMRECSEELLGVEEHGGDGRPVDYTAGPLGELDAAYRDGRVRVWYLGTAVDALTLFGEILTVAVWEPEFFDAWTHDMVSANDEGTLVGERLPFVEPMVRSLLTSSRMIPAGAGCLARAWEHRDLILG